MKLLSNEKLSITGLKAIEKAQMCYHYFLNTSQDSCMEFALKKKLHNLIIIGTLTFFFALSTFFSFGQGFNNDEKYDQQDLDFLFKKNGIEVFKFSFKSKIDSGLNIVIEEYAGNKLIKTHSFFNDFMPMFKIFDEPISFFFPKMNDSIAQYLRFYVTKNTTGFKLSVKTNKIERDYSFVTKNIKLTQTRAFDYVPNFIEKRQPLFVFYGTKKRDLLSCPGDAVVEQVVKMYDYLVVVYADILK